MRRAFDATFAAPPAATVRAEKQMLAVRIAGAGYAIRLAELAGLVAAKRIVPLPGRAPALLGVVGIRGGLVPVYSLAAVLAEEAEHGPPSWLVLCPGEQPLALAFAELEGHLRVAASDFHALDARAFGTQVVRVGRESRAVISIPAVVETITRRVSPDGRPEE
jgi:purine-binding chemotaxis protein CheW